MAGLSSWSKGVDRTRSVNFWAVIGQSALGTKTANTDLLAKSPNAGHAVFIRDPRSAQTFQLAKPDKKRTRRR